MMSPGYSWHGVAVAWHSSLNSFVSHLSSNCERFAAIKVCSDKCSLLVVSLYAPTHGKDEEYLECLSYLAEFILENMSENDSLLIGADTNCSVKSSNRRQKAWNNFCENFSLTTHAGPAPTFHHHNGTSNSLIDSILTTSNLKPSRISQLCTLDSPLNLSSHDVLSLSLSVPLPQTPASKYEHTYKKFNCKKVI